MSIAVIKLKHFKNYIHVGCLRVLNKHIFGVKEKYQNSLLCLHSPKVFFYDNVNKLLKFFFIKEKRKALFDRAGILKHREQTIQFFPSV